jgi:hypothetical protein
MATSRSVPFTTECYQALNPDVAALASNPLGGASIADFRLARQLELWFIELLCAKF